MGRLVEEKSMITILALNFSCGNIGRSWGTLETSHLPSISTDTHQLEALWEVDRIIDDICQYFCCQYLGLELLLMVS